MRGEAGADEVHLPTRARAWFEMLQVDRIPVIVPAPTLAEFLIGTPSEARNQVAQEIGRRFRVARYDARAATINAEIWHERCGGRGIPDELKEQPGYDRVRLKFDAMVVAAALAAGAKQICTHGDGISAWSSQRLPCLKLPPANVQLKIPTAASDEWRRPSGSATTATASASAATDGFTSWSGTTTLRVSKTRSGCLPKPGVASKPAPASRRSSPGGFKAKGHVCVCRPLRRPR